MSTQGFHGTIPQIAQAYQNDPRTRLMNTLMASGTSTAPVASGGWGIAEGLARAASAIGGHFMQQKQERKYEGREQDYMDALKAASALASQPQPQVPGATPATVNPATVNPAAQAPPPPIMAAASALGGMPPQAPQMPPQTPQMASATPLAGMPPMGAGGPPPPGMGAVPSPTLGGTGPSRGATPSLPASAPAAPAPPPARAVVTPAQYYTQGIVPIEAGTDPTTGAFRTSPKGAIGPGQIMPGTAPEAAKLAGLPYDAKRLRTDAAYNNALGQAYYAEQLRVFGDPVKAAAAYNAGPGGLRRAMRKAAKSGQDWTTHLPAETRKYVVNFATRMGDSANGGVQTATPVSATQVAAPNMEAVPGGPEVPFSTPPNAPQRPAEVHSNRMDIAQAMLSSGNPDLAVMAQAYLDTGLTEQNAARTLASGQEFAQGQTGYQANLNDWNDASSSFRNDSYARRRDAQGRNFSRESKYADQTFTAAENAAGRGFQAQESAADRQWRTGESAADRQFRTADREDQQAWTSGENALNRENKIDVAGARQQQRSVFFNSPTGLKMQKENGDQMNANNRTISQFQRFMDLNAKQSTGGVALNTPGISGAYSWIDPQLREMNSIANKVTLGELGGSLGTAISDGDRKFIAEANVGVSAPRQSNDNLARAAIGALRRQNDYLSEFANAQADNNPQGFSREWTAFVNSVPIVQYGKNGKAMVTDKPITFSEWRNSRPHYDASGKRVK